MRPSVKAPNTLLVVGTTPDYIDGSGEPPLAGPFS